MQVDWSPVKWSWLWYWLLMSSSESEEFVSRRVTSDFISEGTFTAVNELVNPALLERFRIPEFFSEFPLQARSVTWRSSRPLQSHKWGIGLTSYRWGGLWGGFHHLCPGLTALAPPSVCHWKQKPCHCSIDFCGDLRQRVSVNKSSVFIGLLKLKL